MRVAVVYEGEQISYRELNRRANQLGAYLRRMGVGPEVLVGVCLERGLEMMVGLLGVLKAGGAYLPLDPKYPLERLGLYAGGCGGGSGADRERVGGTSTSVYGDGRCCWIWSGRGLVRRARANRRARSWLRTWPM